MSDMIAIPLPDGRWIGLTREALREALAAAESLSLGLRAAPATGEAETPTTKLLNSEEMGLLLGVHSTSVEAMAKAGTIPSIRVGAKALRFEPAAVKAALRARSGA